MGKMIYLDANIILRYLLGDNVKFIEKSKNIIDNNDVFIKHEVLAEVVYVLNKTYNVPKDKLETILVDFIGNINIYTDNKEVTILSLKIFNDKNIDFVDSLLCAYKKIENIHVETFDKKLIKCLN